MNMEASSQDVLNAAARHRRYGRLEVMVVGLTVFVVVVVAAVALVVVPRQRAIKENGDSIECIVRHLAAYNEVLAKGIAASPGTPSRENFAAQMVIEAKRLDRDCV